MLQFVSTSVTNPWSFLAIVCITIATVIIRLKTNRFKEHLKQLKKGTDVLKIASLEMKHPIPPNLNPDQYHLFMVTLYEHKLRVYNIAFKFLVVILVASVIVVSTFSILSYTKLFNIQKIASSSLPHCDGYNYIHTLAIPVSATRQKSEIMKMTGSCEDISIAFATLPAPMMIQVCFPIKNDWCGVSGGEDHWLSQNLGKNHWATFDTPNQWKAVATYLDRTTSFYLVFKSANTAPVSDSATMEIAY